MAGLYLDRQDPFAGMVKLHAGTFHMGACDNASPQKDGPYREVTLTQDFWIGRYPVTNRFYGEVMGEEWKTETADKPHCTFPPILYRSDDDNAIENLDFLIKLNQIFAGRLPDGYQFSLPSEAQWEYAAKAGSDKRLPVLLDNDGNIITNERWNEIEKRNYHSDIFINEPLEPVWKYPVNPWGLFGIPGGIWEYCRDLYDKLPEGPLVDPEGPSSRTETDGVHRLTRGVLSGEICSLNEWDSRMWHIGFRLVITRIGKRRSDEADKHKKAQDEYKRRATAFFKALYPDHDPEELLVGFHSEEEFNEYMEFAEIIKREGFSFEKAKFCIIEGLDLLSLDCAVFCKNLALEGVENWEREHSGKKEEN